MQKNQPSLNVHAPPPIPLYKPPMVKWSISGTTFRSIPNLFSSLIVVALLGSMSVRDLSVFVFAIALSNIPGLGLAKDGFHAGSDSGSWWKRKRMLTGPGRNFCELLKPWKSKRNLSPGRCD